MSISLDGNLTVIVPDLDDELFSKIKHCLTDMHRFAVVRKGDNLVVSKGSSRHTVGEHTRIFIENMVKSHRAFKLAKA